MHTMYKHLQCGVYLDEVWLAGGGGQQGGSLIESSTIKKLCFRFV
jgi:hypothetical protein